MRKMVKLNLKSYLKSNYIVFILVVFFFVMGIFFGSIGVNSLKGSQLLNLQNFVDMGLKGMESNFDSQITAKYAMIRNLETLLKIWFLGLTVIGLPLVLIILFSRGFILGFTIGFLVKNKAMKGLGLVLLTIFPQNILYIPALILAAILAINFCIFLVRGNKNESRSMIMNFIRYSLIMGILIFAMIGAGLIEGYLTPVTTTLIKP